MHGDDSGLKGFFGLGGLYEICYKLSHGLNFEISRARVQITQLLGTCGSSVFIFASQLDSDGMEVSKIGDAP